VAELCLVGYTYRGYEMAYACAQARAFGYSGLELRDFRDVDLSTPAGVSDSLRRASRLAADHGLTIFSVFYAPLPVSREGEREEEERAFGEVIAILAEFHVPILHTRLSLRRERGEREVVSAGALESDYEAVKATLSRVARRAEEHGVRLALESHMGTIHDTAASQRRVVFACESPYVTASLDFANLLIAHREESLGEAIRAFGPRIGYTHIKNVKLLPWGYDWNLPVRWGDINYHMVLQTLKEASYRGPLAVEYCGTGDPDVFAEDDANYLRSLLARVGG
jgi:sugar phosphate isomerase/epimerase